MKKKKKLSSVLPMFIGSLFMGGACGWTGINIIIKIIPSKEQNGFMFMLGILIVMIGMYAAFFLQICIHETGHMIFGLMTGYQFSSIRFLNLMFLKTEDGRIKLKKYSLAGTGGQCLMLPPDMQDGKYPYVLYNLGGCILNLLTGILGMALYFLSRGILSGIGGIIGIVGIFTCLLNGIPLKSASNDGYNTLVFSKSRTALKIFWIQLNMIERMAKGAKSTDFPEEWYEYMERIDDFANTIHTSAYVTAVSHRVEKKEFEKVKEMCIYASENAKEMLPLHEGILEAEHLFAHLVTDMDTDKIEQLMDKEHQEQYKLIKTQISMLRIWYAYYLLYKKEKDRVTEFLKKFEAAARTYPYPADVENERELIEYVNKIACRTGNKEVE